MVDTNVLNEGIEINRGRAIGNEEMATARGEFLIESLRTS